MTMKKIVSIGLVLIAQGALLANMGPQGFAEFKNHYFVETGTYGGDSIVKAQQAGFKEIRSIEFDINLFKGASNRFAQSNDVTLYHGDSAKRLWDVIKDIDGQITFWLDAHIYPPNGGKNCPLLEELDQIKQHHIKNHTILIDDMHCAGTEAFDGLTQEDLINKILEINPNYTITYVPGGDGGEYPVNVMVARVLE